MCPVAERRPVRVTRRLVKDFSWKKALYNVTDENYTSARKTSLCISSLTDTNKILIALVAKYEANADGADTGYLITFYVPESFVLLKVCDELGYNDTAGAR